MRTEIGKIQIASFGFGGYQECEFGLSLTFGSKGWGVSTFHGVWGIDRNKDAKWTEENRLQTLGEACMKLRDLLVAANKKTIDELIGTPVEITFEGTTLKSYRVLTEVL